MIQIVQRLAPYILSLVIAILSFVTGAVTDVGQATQIALDKDKALIQATEILNDATPEELKEAITEEKE